MKSILKRYQEHVLSKKCQEEILTPYDLILNIDDVVCVIGDQEKEVISDIKRNLLAQKINQNPILSIFDGRDLSLLEEDGRLLEELFNWMEECSDLFVLIAEYLREDNFLECVRLCDFLVDEYIRNYQFIDGERRGVSYLSQGIRYQDNRYLDTREEVISFIRGKVSLKEDGKQLEKKKEI